MAPLEHWTRRPIEEANLFNPAFLCVLTHEFVKEYSKQHENGASLFLVIAALAISLHRSTRERLPYSTVTPLYAWVQENEDLLIGLATRAKNISPYVKEAAMFGFATQTLQTSNQSALLPGRTKLLISKNFSAVMTDETKMIIERSKFVGRWLAKSGSEISIAGALGIRP